MTQDVGMGSQAHRCADVKRRPVCLAAGWHAAVSMQLVCDVVGEAVVVVVTVEAADHRRLVL